MAVDPSQTVVVERVFVPVVMCLMAQLLAGCPSGPQGAARIDKPPAQVGDQGSAAVSLPSTEGPENESTEATITPPDAPTVAAPGSPPREHGATTSDVPVNGPSPTSTESTRPSHSEGSGQTLKALLADAAVLTGTKLVCADDIQCFGQANWAYCSPDHKQRIHSGDTITVIGSSVHGATFKVTADGEVSVSEHDDLLLAMKHAQPSPTAQIEERLLQRRVTDPTKLGKWLQTKFGPRFGPVGEVRGNFGNGVDRIAVFEPRKWPEYDMEADELPFASEYAVLVANGQPRGVLPFVTKFEQDGEEWKIGVHGIQTAGVVDINGDGTEEILWVFTSGVAPVSTTLSVSFFEDGAFHHSELAGCGYSGCEAFLPRTKCRPGTAKPK